MRSFFWSKIKDDDIDGTIWEELDDAHVELDLATLMSQFAKNKQKTPEELAEEAKKAAEKAAAGAAAKPKEVTLLDGKVLQNVGIALAKYRMPAAQIRTAILEMDEVKLDLEKLNSLYSLAPTAEELTTVKEYDGDKALLGKVERFFLQISDIPRYTDRLQCFIFKLKFDTQQEELSASLKLVQSSTRQVRDSKPLRQIMETVLKVGNYLNGGTSRGGSYGYRLDSLTKLANIKSIDNKQTLMNYVVALCEAVDKSKAGTDAIPMLDVTSTMPDLDEVCRVSLSTWNNDYKGMKKMLTLIETQAAAARKTPFEGDAFPDVMEPFLEHASGAINELGKQYDSTVKFFEDTLVLFAEDPKKVACEDFFGELVLGFTRAFDKARNQNEKKRLMAEKASKQKAAEAQAKDRNEKKQSTMKKGLSAVDKITKKLRRENPDDVMSKLRGPKKGKGRRGSAKTAKSGGAAGADGQEGTALPGMAGPGARAPRVKGPRRLSAQAPPAKGGGGAKSGELASIFSRKAKKK